MATILQFVPPPGSGRISRGAAEGGGSVVIFPGVRYERREPDGPDEHGDHHDDTPAAKRARRGK